MVLNIRTFRRNASQLVDGRVVFPKAQIADGIIPTGGQLIYADNGTDVQTQIATNASNAQASSTSLTAAILANTALITAIDVHAHVQENIVYVDSKRTDSYTEDGSETMPYKTLSGAFIKLANGQTAYTIFKLAPGDYVGTIMRDKATQEQSFEIRGKIASSKVVRPGTQPLGKCCMYSISWTSQSVVVVFPMVLTVCTFGGVAL